MKRLLIAAAILWPVSLGIINFERTVEVKASQELIEFIKQKEGFRSKAYKPLNDDRWTIGYGFTYLNGRPVRPTDVITKEQADAELERLLNEEYAVKLTPRHKVDQHQFDAVLSLAYNVGIYRFLKSDTWRMFNNGGDISHMFDQWVKANGRVVRGLVNRRSEETKIYKEGKYA